MTIHAKFPSPYDLKTPAGAEGWEQLSSLLSQVSGQSSLRGRREILVLQLAALAEPLQTL